MIFSFHFHVLNTGVLFLRFLLLLFTLPLRAHSLVESLSEPNHEFLLEPENSWVLILSQKLGEIHLKIGVELNVRLESVRVLFLKLEL